MKIVDTKKISETSITRELNGLYDYVRGQLDKLPEKTEIKFLLSGIKNKLEDVNKAFTFKLLDFHEGDCINNERTSKSRVMEYNDDRNNCRIILHALEQYINDCRSIVRRELAQSASLENVIGLLSLRKFFEECSELISIFVLCNVEQSRYGIRYC